MLDIFYVVKLMFDDVIVLASSPPCQPVCSDSNALTQWIAFNFYMRVDNPPPPPSPGCTLLLKFDTCRELAQLRSQPNDNLYPPNL